MANYARLLRLRRHPDYAFWTCGHARRPLGDAIPYAPTAREGSPYRACPACTAQNRRNSRHWSALALALVVALLVVCAAATGSCSATASSCLEVCP